MTIVRTTKLLLPVAAIVLCAGCDSALVQDATKKYNLSVQKSSLAMQAYYEQLNDGTRADYFRLLRYKPNDRIKMNIKVELDSGDTGSVPTGLVMNLPADQIEARVQAIAALGAISGGLASIASSDAPARTETQVLSAKAPLTDALKQLDTLAARNNKTRTDFSAFGGPVADLVSIVAGAWVAHMRDQAIKTNAVKGQPYVNALCDALKKDIVRVDALSTGSAQNVANAGVEFYNKKYEPDKTNSVNNSQASGNGGGDGKDGGGKDDAAQQEKDRVALLPTIQADFDRLALVKASNPTILVDDIKRVNDDLVGVINGDAADPNKVQDMYADLEQFTVDADRISGIIAKLQGDSSASGSKKSGASGSDDTAKKTGATSTTDTAKAK